MKRIIIMFYSFTNYTLGVAALVYLIAFLFNLPVPKSIDSGAAGNPWLSAAIDIGLMVLFGLQHSIMARPKFKAWLTRFVPKPAERSTYMIATSIVVFALCLFWQPLPDVLWQADSEIAYYVVLGIGLSGWGLVLVSTFLIDHFDLFGLRQAWIHLTGREYTRLEFRTRSLYRYIRHPIMTGVFIGIWVTPVLTVGHLLFALVMSAYVLIGVYHEEKDLINAFGAQYREYIRETGRFLPRFGSGKRRQGNGAQAEYPVTE